jgi:hypothetical protein
MDPPLSGAAVFAGQALVPSATATDKRVEPALSRRVLKRALRSSTSLPGRRVRDSGQAERPPYREIDGFRASDGAHEDRGAEMASPIPVGTLPPARSNAMSIHVHMREGF